MANSCRDNQRETDVADGADVDARIEQRQMKCMDARGAEQFALLWVAVQPTLSAFIRSLSPNFQQAEEILQRVAVALVRKFDSYDPSRPFAAWAIGVAKFEVLYYRREQATDRHIFDDDVVERIAQSYQRFAEEADPFREALEQCLETLDGRAREVVDLRYSRGMSSPAVAKQMQLSSGAVRMLLSRVRRALRDCIEQRARSAAG